MFIWFIKRAKSKANKLKVYFTKLCDQEAKSLKRNQQILADLQRIDSQFQQFEVKLERLNNVKVTKKYPKIKKILISNVY